MRFKAQLLTSQSRHLMAVGAFIAALTSGCQQKPLCPELGNCGGPDPIGNWDLAPGYPSCMEDLYAPASDLRLAKPNVPPGRTPPPEPAVYDWCDQLVNGARPQSGQLAQYHQPGFYYESGQVGQANLRINQDGSYTLGSARTGIFLLEFPAKCVRMYGAMDGLPIVEGDPTSPVGGVCKQLEKPIADSGTGEGSYSNTICAPNPNDPGGCVCQFDVSETGGPSGPWKRINANTIEFILQKNFPSRATFCNKGGTLELTGADGDYLFGVKGLRTFKMKQTIVPAAPAAPTPTP
jgi:hypothetical protein